MKINEYISNYYCDEYKEDLHLNDFKDDSNLICNYKFYNKFHSVWSPKSKNISNELIYICETIEDENKLKSKLGLNNSEINNFILFEDATMWTSLKYIPFKVILNQLGFPICECVETKDFWWGKLKYPEYKYEKAIKIFDMYKVNPENSKENNLDIILEFLNVEGVIRNSSSNSGSLDVSIDEIGGRSPDIIRTTETLNSVLNGNAGKHLFPRR